MKDQDQLFVKMALSAWETQNTRLDKLLGTLSDEQLFSEVSPGRNSGIYILGHLTAINDALFPLLGWGERFYPQLENIFIKNSDKSGLEKPSPAEVRKYWKVVNAKLTEHIGQTQPEEWFAKHTTVSAEDFAKEPHRNKLNVLMGRTNHLSYHSGQLIFLVKAKK